MRFYFLTVLLICDISIAQAQNVLPKGTNAGLLDYPLPEIIGQKPGKPGVLSLSLRPVAGADRVSVTTMAALRREVLNEQKTLEKLNRSRLQDRAELGDRVAQVALGADFAKEATLLSFAPEAANDALSDAVRWYSLAASRGFPGAPSLDLAGVRFHPIRIQRQATR